MSVLVRGLQIPEDCFLCPCIEYYHPGYVCWITGYQAHHNERPIGCPLVEVPTPHGRLLDADDVFHVLTSYYHHSTDFQREALKEALARVSTIIGEEDGE